MKASSRKNFFVGILSAAALFGTVGAYIGVTAVKPKTAVAAEVDLSVVADFTKQGFTNQQAVTRVEVDPLVFVFDKGTSSNAPKYYTNGTAVRVYGGSSVTVSSSTVKLTKIVITFGKSDGSNTLTADSGTYSSGTWTGEASSVKFTVGGSSGNRRFQSVTVSYTPLSGPSFTVTNAPDKAFEIGDKGTFTATPKDATNPVITWSSSNTDVLSIDASTGTYETKAAGVSEVTATLACDELETPISSSFDLVVNYGSKTISEAISICNGLSGATVTDKPSLTFSGYLVNLDGDGKNRMLVLSDKKKDEEGGVTLNVFGIYSTDVFRKEAIINGYVTISGNPAKYSNKAQIASPSIVDYTDDAMTFAAEANDLLDAECAARDVQEETWNAIKAKFEALDTYAQAKLAAAGTDYAYDDEIKNFVARYVIIVNGYGYEDFMSSSAIKAKNAFFANSAKENGIAAWTIGAGLFALLAAGCFVFLKKKKLAK